MKKVFKKWHGRAVLLGVLYIFIVAAFGVLLFINFYPVGSFFENVVANSTRIYDRNGILLYETLNPEAGRTQFTPLSEISPYVIAATVAAEDASFYSNVGIDLTAMVRAVFDNAQSGKVVSGASTITQQLVRNVLGVNRSRTVLQKIKEALLAIRINKKYSKDQILELYLNKVYYGNLNYGVAAAAYSYFGTNPRDLDLAQSAFIAGLPQAPNRYDPFKNKALAIEREQSVLDALRRTEKITQEEYDAARAEKLVFEPKTTVIRAPHFVHYVIEELEDRFGPDYAIKGLTVRTTLDLHLNDSATAIARRQIEIIKNKNVTNASVVVLEPKTGAVRAMVGSLDYFDDNIEGRVNIATASRQPGSAMKPITYAVAFEKGWTGATQILDEPVRFFTADGQPYYPKNYDFEYHGLVSVREALSNSYNIPAVHAIEFAGVADVLSKAHAMGITTLNDTPDHYGLALTLGDGEVRLLDLTQVYAVLAAGGVKHDPFVIEEIRNSDGDTVYQHAESAGTSVVGDDIAFMLTDILSDSNARIAQFGVNNVLELDRPAAVKTGTTRNYRDNWTMGFTPDFAVGVWVGNTNNEPMKNVSGVMGAGPIWRDVMNEVHRGLPIKAFNPPASVEQKKLTDSSTIDWISKRIPYDRLDAKGHLEAREFAITKPFDLDVFEYQPHLDADVQQIKFSAAPVTANETVTWFVDDISIGSGAEIFWKLAPGEHTIKATKTPLQTSTITITVESKRL